MVLAKSRASFVSTCRRSCASSLLPTMAMTTSSSVCILADRSHISTKFLNVSWSRARIRTIVELSFSLHYLPTNRYWVRLRKLAIAFHPMCCYWCDKANYQVLGLWFCIKLQWNRMIYNTLFNIFIRFLRKCQVSHTFCNRNVDCVRLSACNTEVIGRTKWNFCSNLLIFCKTAPFHCLSLSIWGFGNVSNCCRRL